MDDARRRALIIVGSFLLFSYTWIVGTEPLVVPIAETTGWSVVTVEVAKGLLFVTLAAGLLWWSLRWYLQLAASSERRWEDLATSMHEGLFVMEMGRSPRLLWANGAFERITGRRLCEFQADPTLPFQIVADEDTRALRSAWLSPLTQNWPVLVRLVLPDGSDRYVEVSGTAAGGRGQQLFQGLLVDVTGAKERERQLQAAAAAERSASDELSRMMAVKDGLLTALSHELRTPLTVVSGWAQTLQQHRGRMSRAQQLQAETAIWEQSQRLATLVDDLLQLERFDRGEVATAPTACDPGQVVAATVAASPAGRRVTVTVPERLEVVIDREQLRRVVQELLGNVEKYAPEGPVAVEVGSNGGRWWLQVSDAGPGLPDGTDDEVFEPFVRYDLDHHSPGAGLGLPLVARYVDANGGTIGMDSGPDGLTVTITFPLELPVRRPTLKAV